MKHYFADLGYLDSCISWKFKPSDSVLSFCIGRNICLNILILYSHTRGSKSNYFFYYREEKKAINICSFST